jgi:hypothetical protein
MEPLSLRAEVAWYGTDAGMLLANLASLPLARSAIEGLPGNPKAKP